MSKIPSFCWLRKNLPLILISVFVFLHFQSAESQQLGTPGGMVLVPSGYFTRGSDSSEIADEKPSGPIFVDSFYIDQFEVTNEEYMKFVTATGHEAPKFIDKEGFNAPGQPVVGVSWLDAMAYAKWAGKRLPTEAEWEKAARGTDSRKWPWGSAWEGPGKYLNILGDEDGFEFVAPANQYPEGAGPYGAYNMAGNVWEWCSDWYDVDYYKISPEINPSGPTSGKRKVLRGGSWVNKIEHARSAKRARNFPDVKLEIYGFRCALDAR